MTEKSIQTQAKEIVEKYKITIQRNKPFGFIGSSIELPIVTAHGVNVNICYQRTIINLKKAVIPILKAHIKPPTPISELTKIKKRTKQVNVRLTKEEKEILTKKARDLGFEGLGDFFRNSAIEKAKHVLS